MANASETMRFLMNAYSNAQAGTDDEAKAADALSQLYYDHGLEPVVTTFKFDEFSSVGKALLGIVVAFAGIVGGASLGALPIVMFVLAVACALLYVLESYGIHTVSRLGRRQTSQNIVARHPGTEDWDSQSHRTIVVLAHYDTPCGDILAIPALKRVRPYILGAVHVSAIAIVVALFLMMFPVPTLLHSILWAIAIVAALIILIWAVAEVLHAFVLPTTDGANDNRSGVAVVLGLLDRVRGATGRARPRKRASDAYTTSSRREYSRDSYENGDYQQRSAVPQAVHHGEQMIRDLGLVPATCEIVYESPESVSFLENDGQPEFSGSIHLASEVNEIADEEVIRGETMMFNTGAPLEGMPVVDDEVDDADLDEPFAEPDPEEQKDRTADAIMTGILSAESMDAGLSESQQATSVVPSTRIAELPTTDDEPLSSPSLSTPYGERVVASPSDTFVVITSKDEPDAELRHSTGALPFDLTDSSTIAAQNFFNDELSPTAEAVVSSSEWGTTTFAPVVNNRRILREDIPDPAVAAVDPYSVNSVEMTSEFNPDDFSNLDFETGTHTAVTPAMLEEVQRRNLDGFTEFSAQGSKRGRRGRRGQTGRISQQAEQMRAEMEEQSFTDWMGLDEDFDAKTSGRKIGSWDNFDDEAPKPNNGWQGGATRARTTRFEAVDDSSSSEVRQAAMTLGDKELATHEIWFVLTGAGDGGHAGAREFLESYSKELRGSYVINLECVGAGEPCLLIEEGAVRHTTTDHRLVNLFGAASSAINRPLGLARLKWRDTEVSEVLRSNSYRAITVCGMDGDAPAHSRWSGDTADKLDFNQIDDIVDIIAEVIKQS